MVVTCDFNSISNALIVQVSADQTSGYYTVTWVDPTATASLKVSRVDNTGAVINTFTLATAVDSTYPGS